MRADILAKILPVDHFHIIDTHVPFFETNKLFRSLGFRYKTGPLVKKINSYIREQLNEVQYDLIWIDKGVFVSTKTIKTLRSKTFKLIHYTPDPAFTFHNSKWFNQSLPYYDFLFTTKSFELDIYKNKATKAEVLFVTQGYDSNLHQKASFSFKDKSGFLFIGHYEKHRELVLQKLLEKNITIILAGIKWERFVKKNQSNKYLKYLGKGVYGEDYVKAIQKAQIAWGALSKWIPELHTTRTFEIPACGTALLTEKNKETSAFFKENEVLFYESEEELVDKVTDYLKRTDELEEITRKGHERISKDGYDYESILKKILERIKF